MAEKTNVGMTVFIADITSMCGFGMNERLMNIFNFFKFIMSYLPTSTPSVRSTVLPGAPALHA